MARKEQEHLTTHKLAAAVTGVAGDGVSLVLGAGAVALGPVKWTWEFRFLGSV